MVFRWGLTLVVVLGLSFPAAAEFYKYRDKNGAIRFTDNLALVPPDQRPKLKVYEGAAQPAAPSAVATPNRGEPEPAAVEASEEQAAAEGEIAALRQRQEALMAEYDGLQKEREALAPPVGRRVSEDEQKAYNRKVEALNAKLKSYQERRDAYEREVTAHNEKMKQRLMQKPEKASAQ